MKTPWYRVLSRTALVVVCGFCPAFVASALAADPPGARAGGRALSLRGAVSADDENEGGEADPKFRPEVREFRPRAAASSGGTQAKGSAASSGGSAARMKDHPNAQALLQQLQGMYEAREVNVSLLNGHKYMINDCLGLKVSAGEFKLKFINPSVRLEGSGVVFECGISRIDMSAIKLRMRPRVPPWDDPNPCKFSKKFEVGGSAKDVRIIMRFDPLLDLERCRIADVTSIEIRVRIDELNLKPLQNDLDRMAKDMVEDSLTYFLNVNFLSQFTQTLDDLIEADCPGNPGNAGRSIRRTVGGLSGGAGGGGAGSGGSGSPTPAADAGAPAAGQSGAARPDPADAGAGPAPGSPTVTPPPAAPAADASVTARLRELESRVAELEGRLANSAAAPAGPSPAADTGPAAAPKSEPAARGVGRPVAGGSGAYAVVPSADLKGRLGRLVVAFPEAGGREVSAFTAVHRAGSKERVDGFYKNGELELMPGTYDIVISGRLVPNVPVQSRHDTRIHVGILRLNGGSGTFFSIHNVGEKERLEGHYGSRDVGLPVGEYEVMVKDDRQKVTVAQGRLTDF